MAQLLRQQDLDVEIDFYGFCLQEVDDTQVPLEYPEGRAGDTFLTAHEARLDIESAGHTHTATLTVEVWDGQPPEAADRAAWEERGEVQIHCPSGGLAIWAVTGGAMDTYLQLSDTGDTWKVRVYCAGREEVRRLAQDSVPEGIEKYLAQFWPVER